MLTVCIVVVLSIDLLLCDEKSREHIIIELNPFNNIKTYVQNFIQKLKKHNSAIIRRQRE